MLQLYGMLVKNTLEENYYLITLEKMKKLKLYVNFRKKDKELQLENLW